MLAIFLLVAAVFVRAFLAGETVGRVKGDRDRIGARSKVSVLVKRHVRRGSIEADVELQLRVVGSVKWATWDPGFALTVAKRLEEAAAEVRRREAW
ncbi:MAG TPA: hypothetical protein VEC19_09665 [Usitatibacter sp.]|nr:hypothetical protein [Usitatibacter sp.]